jgi:hypothetical protein
VAVPTTRLNQNARRQIAAALTEMAPRFQASLG